MSAEKQERLVVSIDQGTSSSRVVVFSARTGQVVACHQIPFTSSYPAPGWIEQNANQLYDTTLECLNECAKQIEDQGRDLKSIIALGVTNQRETTIVWDRETGKPLAPAIVWSDARTADLVKEFTSMTPNSNPNAFQAKTGLPIHSYFSALKLCWLLENHVDVAEANENGTLLAGTVDCWIIWRLTNGKCHVTDVTNASRTMLMNLHTLDWDPDLCR
ncbi:Glycerol kinase [Fasciolopsis buskii]|uniref:glycerol kinase n=1 Tax=Fasciolopsis buskii TaxID=27845 RepID=A0A8E0RS53_9TREM|nr:Glycerol kinase [Fasciolopsis buski]